MSVVNLTCKNCHNTYVVLQRTQNKPRVFCSKKCMGEYNRIKARVSLCFRP